MTTVYSRISRQKTTRETNFQTKNLSKITPIKYGDEKMEEDEMSGTCGTIGEEEICVQCFGGERRTTISLETWPQTGG